jgi:hypothetical protein
MTDNIEELWMGNRIKRKYKGESYSICTQKGNVNEEG